MAKGLTPMKKKAVGKAKATARTKVTPTKATPTKNIDKEDDGDRLMRAKKRLRRRDTHGQVKNILYDNFRMFTEEEVYLREVNNTTLYELLMADRKRWKAGELEMGMKYYIEKRCAYMNPDNVIKKLQCLNQDDKEDPTLKAALVAMAEDKHQTSPIFDWMDNADEVNDYNFVALCRQLVSMPLSRNQEKTTLNLAAMKMVHRLQLHTKHVVTWSHVKKHFDRTLCSSLAFFRAQGAPVSFWWKHNNRAASIIVPADVCGRCIAHEGDWNTISADVVTLHDSSDVGEELMRTAILSLGQSKLTEAIDQAVDRLAQSPAPITSAYLAQERALFLTKVKELEIDATKPYDKPETIKNRYRGLVFSQPVSSAIDFYNMRVGAWWRGLAVDLGELAPLWCESDLVGPRVVEKRSMDATMLADAKGLRESLEDELSLEELSAANIEDIMIEKATWLQSLDNKARIDIHFWRSSIGEKARQRVQEAMLKCVPDERHHMTLEASCKAMEALEGSKLLSFAGIGLQSLFSTVFAMVKTLSTGGCPTISSAGDSQFSQQVSQRLGCFFQCPTDPSRPVSAENANIIGEKAVKAMFDHCSAKFENDKKSVSVDHVAQLHSFAFLLSAENAKTLRTMGTQITASKARAVAPAKKVKKGGMKATDAKEHVAALFARPAGV